MYWDGILTGRHVLGRNDLRGQMDSRRDFVTDRKKCIGMEL